MTTATAPTSSTDGTSSAHERDAELMRRVAAGEAGAFVTLHREQYRAVYRLALTIVLDREEARDVTQEVFVRLHRIAPRWQPRAAVRTWLYRTTLNVALGMGRKLRRWLRPRGGTPAPERDAEDRALAAETLDQVRDALAKLSPRQRAVVGLHLDAELGAQAIGEQLGISPNAVRVTLHKGLQRLRATLQDPHGAPTPDGEDPVAPEAIR